MAIFIWTIGVILQSLLPTGAQVKAIRRFLQVQGTVVSLESNVTFLSGLLCAGAVALALYLLRLYLSLQLFDRVPNYYHSYLRNMPRYLRPAEWLLRLMVFLYLLVGLQLGFERVSRRIVSYAVDVFSLTTPASIGEWLKTGQDGSLVGADRFIPTSVFLVTLFILFLIWDVFFVVCWATSDKMRAQISISHLFKRFFVAHIAGLVVWIGFLLLFWDQSLFARSPMWIGMVVCLLILLQLYDNGRALIPTKDSRFWTETAETFSEPTAFALGVRDCTREEHHAALA